MLKYIAGDFPEKTTASEKFGVLALSIPTNNIWKPEFVELKNNIQSVDILTEENKHKLVKKAGWGLVGMATFGPAGAVAGLILGGKKKLIYFVCETKDCRKFMGECDIKTYQTLLKLSYG